MVHFSKTREQRREWLESGSCPAVQTWEGSRMVGNRSSIALPLVDSPSMIQSLVSRRIMEFRCAYQGIVEHVKSCMQLIEQGK